MPSPPHTPQGAAVPTPDGSPLSRGRYISDFTMLSFRHTTGAIYLVPNREGIGRPAIDSSLTSDAALPPVLEDPNASCATHAYDDESQNLSLGPSSPPIVMWSPEQRQFVPRTALDLASEQRQHDASSPARPARAEQFSGVYGTYEVGQVTFLVLISEVAVAATGVPQYGTIFRISGLKLFELPRAQLVRSTPVGGRRSPGISPQHVPVHHQPQGHRRPLHLDEDVIAYYRSALERFCTMGDYAGGVGLFTCYESNAVIGFGGSTGDLAARSPLFCWNGDACTRAMDAFPQYVPPVFRGYVGYAHVTAPLPVEGGAATLKVALIARLSAKRAGTRYNRRGIGMHGGHVANFVETEQLVWREGGGACGDCWASSYVSVRGSVPVSWTQHSDLRIVPRLQLPEALDAEDIERHLDLLNRLYERRVSYASPPSPPGAGQVGGGGLRNRYIFVDLLGSASHEARLSCRYEETIQEHKREVSKVTGEQDANTVSYIHINLNKELKAIKRGGGGGSRPVEGGTPSVFDKVSDVVLDAIRSELPECSWDVAVNCWRLSTKGVGGEIRPIAQHSSQAAVVRVNCLDCLDRSNIVQSVVNMRALRQQMSAVLPPSALATDFDGSAWERSIDESVDRVTPALRSLWVGHGNQLSQLYTGTSAHGGDIVRYGAHVTGQFAGGFAGLSTALRRWRNNNFFDGPKQDVISFITGAHTPANRCPAGPIYGGLTLNVVLVGITYGLCICAMIANTIVLLADGYTVRTWFGIEMGWFALLVSLIVLTVQRGGRVVAIGPVLSENRH